MPTDFVRGLSCFAVTISFAILHCENPDRDLFQNRVTTRVGRTTRLRRHEFPSPSEFL